MPFDILPVALLLAIAPGYITIYFATHGRTGRPLQPDLLLILQSLVVSAVLLALLGPIAYSQLWPIRDHLIDHQVLAASWLLVVVVVAPYLVGRTSRYLATWTRSHASSRIGRAIRFLAPEGVPPSLWDWAVENDALDNRFVVIEFADGRRICGAHGRPGVSLTSPESHGVYLAVEYEERKGRWVRVPGSAGVLVPLDEAVRCIHLLQGETGGKNVADIERRIVTPDEEKGLKPAREDPPENPPPPPPPDPGPEQA